MSKLRRTKMFFISLLVIVSSIFVDNARLNADESDTDVAKDVTSLVSITDVSMYLEVEGSRVPIIENGIEVPDHPPLVVDGIVHLDYKWSIPDATILMSGDYFEIDLPMTYIDIRDTAEFLLTDSEGIHIGTWKVSAGKIITTFNENVEGKLSINNGYFSAGGSLSLDGSGIEIETGGIIFPPLTIEPKPIENLPEFPDYGMIQKNGSQSPGNNTINWHMFVNYENYKNVFEGLPAQQMNNVILEDTLTDDMFFIESKLEIAHVLYRPTDDGKMAESAFSYMNIIVEFQKIEQEPSETYEDFKARIENSSVPAYGVFSRKNLVINFKDLPNGGNGIKNPYLPDDASLNSYLDNLVASNAILASQRDIIFNAFSSTNSVSGDIVGFQVAAPTEVVGTSGDYSNVVKLKYDNIETETSSMTINFTEVNGGASTTDPGTLTVTKADDDGEKLENVSFKLEKKNASGGFDEYRAPDGGTLIRKTNAAGKVSFAKLGYGDYRLVEVEGLTGYKSTAVYSPSEYFTIDNSQIRGIDIGVLNYLDEGSVELVKKNTSNLPLANAEFHLYKVDGTLTSYYTGTDADGLATWSTDEVDAFTFITLLDGKVNTTGLVSGTYYFVEIKAPIGYILDETPVQVEVTKARILAATPDSKELVNYRLGSVTLKKVDDTTGQGLEGAEFTLFDAMDEPVHTELKSDANGNITVTELSAGDYYFVETKAPNGYKLDDTAVAFIVVDRDENTISLTKENTKISETEEPGSPDSEKTSEELSIHLANSPSTGDETSVAGLMGIVLLSLFLFVYKAKKN